MTNTALLTATGESTSHAVGLRNLSVLTAEEPQVKSFGCSTLAR